MIYTIGNIAVSGNTLTGTGTNFKAPLSMIRVGCTVIVKSDPIQIFSITEIVSETELSVTPAASPDIPAGTAYSILLCDSVSVDGLAQDVAEALRYFTGQESEIYAAVEYWKKYGDDAQVEALLTAIQAETAQSTANAQKTEADKKTTEGYKNAAATSATAAKSSQDAAKASETSASNSKTAAATSETNAAKSAADALNYRNHAQGIVGDNIGLGASPRDCPDISGNPSGYIGFMCIREAATGFPSIASGEVYLTGFISGVDESQAYTGIFQGWASRSLYTYRWSENTGSQWTRHAEVSRFDHSNNERTVIFSSDDKSTGCYLQLDTNGRWGYYSQTDQNWKALAIEQGGTGATDAATACTNLGLGATNDVQHKHLTLACTSDETYDWVAGGVHKSVLLNTDGATRAEGLMYAECNESSTTQITFAIHSATEDYKYLSFNTEGQILAETAVFRSTYTNPLVIESVNPTVIFRETDRPDGAPEYVFVCNDGGWCMQKGGYGYNGEHIIRYNYDEDHVELEVPFQCRNVDVIGNLSCSNTIQSFSFSSPARDEVEVPAFSAYSKNGFTPAATFLTANLDSNGTTTAQGEFRATGARSVQLINRDITSAGSFTGFYTFDHDKLNCPGTVTCTSVTQTSDKNKKENINEIQNAREMIQYVDGYTFNFIGDTTKRAGVIAQEWQKVLPQVVHEVTTTKELIGPTKNNSDLTGDETVLGVDYSGVTGYLVRLCKEQDAALVAQDERITNLENQVSELVALVKQLTGSEK
ncbi:tail fiber domain-containing protein [Escherichia coli]